MIDNNIVGMFCEDIREEADQKYSLMGIFPDNLNIARIPAAIPRLGIYVRVNIAVDYAVPTPMVLTLRFPSGRVQELSNFTPEQIKIELDKSKAQGSPYAGFLFRAVASPAPITEAGRMIAVVTLNGQEVVAAHVNIQVTPTS